MRGGCYDVSGLVCSVPPYMTVDDLPCSQKDAVNAFAAKRFMSFVPKDHSHGPIGYAADNITCLAVHGNQVRLEDVSWVFAGNPGPRDGWALAIAPPIEDCVDLELGTNFYRRMFSHLGEAAEDAWENRASVMTMTVALPAVAAATALVVSDNVPSDVEMIACVAAEWCDWEREQGLWHNDVPVLYDGSGHYSGTTLGKEDLLSFECHGAALRCICPELGWDGVQDVIEADMMGLAALNVYRKKLESSFATLGAEGRTKMVCALSNDHIVPARLVDEEQYALYSLVFAEDEVDGTPIHVGDRAVSSATKKLEQLDALWESALAPLGASLSYYKFRDATPDPCEKARQMCEHATALGIPQTIDAFFSGVPYEDLVA